MHELLTTTPASYSPDGQDHLILLDTYLHSGISSSIELTALAPTQNVTRSWTTIAEIPQPVY